MLIWILILITIIFVIIILNIIRYYNKPGDWYYRLFCSKCGDIGSKVSNSYSHEIICQKCGNNIFKSYRVRKKAKKLILEYDSIDFLLTSEKNEVCNNMYKHMEMLK